MLQNEVGEKGMEEDIYIQDLRIYKFPLAGETETALHSMFLHLEMNVGDKDKESHLYLHASCYTLHPEHA